MRVRRSSWLVVLVVVALAASPLLARKKRRGTGYDGPDPCARIGAGLLKNAWGEAPKADLTSSRGRYAKELCTLRWDKPNAAALKAEMTKNMGKMMAARMKAQQEGRTPPPLKFARTDNEVGLTYGRKLFKTRKRRSQLLRVRCKR